MSETLAPQPETPHQPPRETLNWHDVLGAPTASGEQPAQEVVQESVAGVPAGTEEVVPEVQHAEAPAVMEQVVQVDHAALSIQESTELLPELVVEDTVTAMQPEAQPLAGATPQGEANPVTEDLIEIATDDPSDKHLVALSQAAHFHGGN